MTIEEIIVVSAIEKRIQQAAEALNVEIKKLQIEVDPIRVLISAVFPDGKLYATYELGPLAAAAVVDWAHRKVAILKPISFSRSTIRGDAR